METFNDFSFFNEFTTGTSLLSTCCVTSSVLDPGDKADTDPQASSVKYPLPRGADFPLGEGRKELGEFTNAGTG